MENFIFYAVRANHYDVNTDLKWVKKDIYWNFQFINPFVPSPFLYNEGEI